MVNALNYWVSKEHPRQRHYSRKLAVIITQGILFAMSLALLSVTHSQPVIGEDGGFKEAIISPESLSLLHVLQRYEPSTSITSALSLTAWRILQHNICSIYQLEKGLLLHISVANCLLIFCSPIEHLLFPQT